MTLRSRKTGWSSGVAVMALLLALAAPAFADPTGSTGAVEGVTGSVASTAASADNKIPAINVTAGGAYSYKGGHYVLPRTKLDLRVATSADIVGQSVTVEIFKNGKLLKRKAVTLNASKDKSVAHYAFRTAKKGRYTFRLALTDEQKALVTAGKSAKVKVVRTNIHSGSRGVTVRLFQNKLRKLAYVAPLNGRFDAATGRAFIAFRKVNRMARRASAGYSVARKLAEGRGGFKLRYPKAGRHIEVSIGKQVMAFANNGKVVRTYHVSTGAPATPTVRGTYRVYRKDWGTNAKGMVNSSYFIRGYAIHGFASVPTYNASHGCVRVPVPNAASIFRWVHMGTRVDTYY